MARRSGIHRMIVLSGVLLFMIGVAVVARTAQALESCDTYLDTVYLGNTSIQTGNEAAITIRVGTEAPINGFSFYLQLPDHVTDENQIDVEPGTCPWDFEPWYFDPAEHRLLINHTTGGDYYTPNTSEVFLTLKISTHCWIYHDWDEWITWVPSNPLMPTSYLAHIDCNPDPLNVQSDGYIFFHNYCRWEISNETAMLGENVTVTILCKNYIELSSFTHAVTYDDEALEFVTVHYLPRTATGVNHQPGDGRVDFYGYNGDGFGKWYEDGADFYQVEFRVISSLDDQTLPICYAAEPREMLALDCGQALGTDIPGSISYNCGSVTIPAYLAEFDLGEATWDNMSYTPAYVEVPVLLKNNYEVTAFNLAMEYYGDLDDDHLYFDDFISASGDWDLTGMDQVCTPGDYRYAKLETMGWGNIPPSADFRIIGYLRFTRDVGDTPDPNESYTLEIIPDGCGAYPTWVYHHTPNFEVTYYYNDPQISFDPGTINIEHGGLIEISVPGVYGHCDKWGLNCEWYESTSFNVRTDVDLDLLTFNIPWTPDEFCVSEHDLQGNTQVTVDDDLCIATVTITNISASPDWVWYGCLRFRNATYVDQWGDIDVTDIYFEESDPGGGTQTQVNAGGIHLYALPPRYLSCRSIVVPPIEKQASMPLQFELGQNRPNPFNASTLIEFSLAEAAHTTMDVYNVMGRRVARVLDEFTEAGHYSISWNGRNEYGTLVASGMYFYRLESAQHVATKKMVLMK